MWIIIIAVIVAMFCTFARFTIVKEGTAKVVVKVSAYKRTLMVWKGYKLDENQEVVPVVPGGKELLHLLGGLRFVGIWPLDKVYRYNFRWRNVELVKGEEKIEFHEKEIDYIFVRPDVYWTDIKAAETAPPERIPLNAQFLVTIRVSNPAKALFKAPSNWNENAMSRFNALARSWVGTKTLDNILELKKDPLAMWKEFENDPLIKMFEREWGIKVEQNGIEIRDIELPPDYQTAAAAQKKLEFEAVARSAETVGTVLEMMARSRGKSLKEIQEEIERTPEMRREFLDLAKDLVVRKLGIEGRSYLDIRVQGAEGIERTILNALAAWKRMPMGKIPAAGKKGPKKEGTETEEDEKSDEADEKIKEAQRTYVPGATFKKS